MSKSYSPRSIELINTNNNCLIPFHLTPKFAADLVICNEVGLVNMLEIADC